MTQNEAAQAMRELQQAGLTNEEIEAAIVARGSLQSDAAQINASARAIYAIMIERPARRLLGWIKSVFKP